MTIYSLLPTRIFLGLKTYWHNSKKMFVILILSRIDLTSLTFLRWWYLFKTSNTSNISNTSGFYKWRHNSLWLAFRCLRKVISNNQMAENFHPLLPHSGLSRLISSYLAKESKTTKKVSFNKHWRKWGLLK